MPLMVYARQPVTVRRFLLQFRLRAGPIFLRDDNRVARGCDDTTAPAVSPAIGASPSPRMFSITFALFPT